MANTEYNIKQTISEIKLAKAMNRLKMENKEEVRQFLKEETKRLWQKKTMSQK